MMGEIPKSRTGIGACPGGGGMTERINQRSVGNFAVVHVVVRAVAPRGHPVQRGDGHASLCPPYASSIMNACILQRRAAADRQNSSCDRV
jgi:hypothetical protein